MSFVKEFEHLQISLKNINLATNNFGDDHCIGRGGFGKVYRGELLLSCELTMVAIKRLDGALGQGAPEFWREIMMLSLYKHENIVSLLGFCNESGESILVYEYLPNRSLDLYIKTTDLSWEQRLRICIGAARGLQYLHDPNGTQQRVLHRDIKSANILLDKNWNAKISDFGLSKIGPANQRYSFLISNAVGTFGYCDPLYIKTGCLTKESDIFSFGVVLFEILCGRFCLENHDNASRFLSALAQRCYEEGKIDTIIKSDLKEQISKHCLERFSTIAYQCLHEDRTKRPVIAEIVNQLHLTLRDQEEIKDEVANKTLEVQILDHAKALQKPVGVVHVKVLRAIKLRKKDLLGRSDPYVKIKLTESKLPWKRTAIKHNNLNPEWNEGFTLVVGDPESQAVEFQVYNWEEVGIHGKMGMNVVPLKELVAEKVKVLTLDLLKNMDPNDVKNEKSRGQIVVELLYEPEATPAGGGLLVVIVDEAQDVEGKHHTNPYVRVLFRGEERKTKHVKKNRDPRWDEEFRYVLDEPPMNDRLHVEVASSSSRFGLLHPKESLGYIDINLADVVHNRRIKDKYHLIDSRNGTIQIELQWWTAS